MTASTVSVLFDLPQRIIAGLGDGSMLRRGGVIQWATGADKGGVVAWLRESPSLVERQAVGAPLPATVAQQMSAARIATGAILGVQVLNLGVTVAGFAYVAARLRALDAKLSAVAGEIAATRDDIRWLDRRQDASALAKATAALDSAHWAERTGRMEELAHSRAGLVEAEHHFAALIAAASETGRAYAHAPAFGGYFAMRALTGIARVHVETVLDDADSGHEAVQRLAQALARDHETFVRPLVEFGAAAPALVRLTADQRGSLTEVASGVRETVDRVVSTETELRYCVQRGIDYASWRALGSKSDEPSLVVLEPTSRAT